MRRWLPRLAVAALVLVVLGVVAIEWAGRSLTERFAEEQLREAGVAGGVEVTVGSAWWRPSVLPALLTGDVDRVSVRLQDAQLYSLPVVEADYVLEDLAIDVSVADRTVTATSLGSGSVRVMVDPAAIAQALGTSAEPREGGLVLGPQGTPATLRVVGRDLVVTSPAIATPDRSTSFRVADPQLLPCEPQVELHDDLIELSCTGNVLPGVLERSIGTSGVSGEAPSADLPPPATLEQPAATEAPVTEPPSTAPAATEPPATEPPATEPPATEAPPEGGGDGGG